MCTSSLDPLIISFSLRVTIMTSYELALEPVFSLLSYFSPTNRYRFSGEQPLRRRSWVVRARRLLLASWTHGRSNASRRFHWPDRNHGGWPGASENVSIRSASHAPSALTSAIVTVSNGVGSNGKFVLDYESCMWHDVYSYRSMQ